MFVDCIDHDYLLSSVYPVCTSSNTSSLGEVVEHDAITEKMGTDTANITSRNLMPRQSLEAFVETVAEPDYAVVDGFG